MNAASEWMEVNKAKGNKNLKGQLFLAWSPPNVGNVKLNVDESSYVLVVGLLVVVLRDCDVCWVGGFAANVLAGKSWIQKLGDFIPASNRLLIKAKRVISPGH